MKNFVPEDSIVRKIWSKTDTVLFIFAGASAEFALNKAVDWLYFTGRLPADPLGRLFSTVAYSQRIIFSGYDEAKAAIDVIAAIHGEVEKKRGAKIPDWAYRDVLFMLIHYTIASFEALERMLTPEEKEEIFHVFYRVGYRMQLNGLPHHFQEWLIMREEHLEKNLVYSAFTKDLYKQYFKHLGFTRFYLLKQVQALVAPPKVKRMLNLRRWLFLRPLLTVYKLCRLVKLDKALKEALLPVKYKKEIKGLEVAGYS
jgi:hypothetical protein